jgi:RNase P/RNase MRP subunit POP5
MDRSERRAHVMLLARHPAQRAGPSAPRCLPVASPAASRQPLTSPPTPSDAGARALLGQFHTSSFHTSLVWGRAPAVAKHRQVAETASAAELAMVVQSARHFLVRVEHLGEDPAPFLVANLTSALRASVCELFGDVGIGCIGSTLVVKHYCAPAGYVLVRTARKHAGKMHAAIISVRYVNKRPARLSVVHTAGSRRTASRAMLARLERSLAAHGRRPEPAELGLCSGTEPPAAAATGPSVAPGRDPAGDIRRVIRDLTNAED